MENIANKEESEKCLRIAKASMERNDFEKAIKFLDKSIKLYPLPGVTELRKVAVMKLSEANGSEKPSTNSNNHSDRASTASNNNNNGSTPAAPAASPGSNNSNSRPYTDQQESGAIKILKLSKKSHYEVLGITHTANEDDIKKAYRKLALKYHPDKNSAPSAEGAFKAISSAFEILSDAGKRREYDQVGHESFQSSGTSGGGSGHHTNMNGHEMSPEDLFNMFFNGGLPTGGGGMGPGFQMHFGPGGRMHSRRQYTRHSDDSPSRSQGNRGGWQLLQILPMLLLFLMSFFSMQNNGGESPYALNAQGRYIIPRKTTTSGVTSNIPYYVTDQFVLKYGKSSKELRKVERSVEADFRDLLARRCNAQREYRARAISQARGRFYRTLQERKEAESQAASYETVSCDEYSKYFNQYEWAN